MSLLVGLRAPQASHKVGTLTIVGWGVLVLTLIGLGILILFLGWLPD